jgi:hypothetical protein
VIVAFDWLETGRETGRARIGCGGCAGTDERTTVLFVLLVLVAPFPFCTGRALIGWRTGGGVAF